MVLGEAPRIGLLEAPQIGLVACASPADLAEAAAVACAEEGRFDGRGRR